MARKIVLPPEEPHFGPWTVEPLETLVQLLVRECPDTPAQPCIVAIDGRSGSGKSTLAAALQKAISNVAVVHTDDIPTSSNWSGRDAYTPHNRPAQRSFFDWTERLLMEVLRPARAGQAVQYRPPAWDDWNREENAIDVPLECSLLILEGVGAARRELTNLLYITIWVQSGLQKARTRGVERDGDNAEAAAFWEGFMSEELPFLADQRPWERADIVLNSTLEGPHDPSKEIVIAESSYTRGRDRTSFKS